MSDLLESLYFDVIRGGVHSEIYVTVKDGGVYHQARLYNAMPVIVPDKDKPYGASTEWLMRLARLNLSRLERSYSSDRPEDVVWSIRYKETDGEEVLSHGSGAYPPGWDDFLLLMDELAPEAEFIDPELIENIYMTYTSTEETQFGPQDYTEVLSLDRRSQKLLYRRSFSDDVYAQTEYRNMNEVSIGLDLWDRYFADAPHVMLEDNAKDPPARLDVRVGFHDGSQEHFLWHYNRTCLPENWPHFIGLIAHRLQLSAMFINMITPSVYMKGARAGEIIYCTVKIPSLNRSYYFTTEDNSLEKGDKVLVPFGEDSAPMSGEITKVEYFYPENAPHPLEETRSIIGRDFDHEKEIRR